MAGTTFLVFSRTGLYSHLCYAGAECLGFAGGEGFSSTKVMNCFTLQNVLTEVHPWTVYTVAVTASDNLVLNWEEVPGTHCSCIHEVTLIILVWYTYAHIHLCTYTHSPTCTLFHTHMHVYSGGIYTPSVALGNTNIIQNLENTGKVKFEVLQNWIA